MSAPPFRRALVLTAGLGTRLRPLTDVRAKAAVPVDGEPLARRVIGWLVSHGITDLVLNLHHRPDTITALVGDGCDLAARVRYSWESVVLGSAGGPRRALPLLLDRGRAAGGAADRTLLLVNGDTMTNVDLAALGARHRESGARVTMALIENPRPDKYGGVVLDAAGHVTGFTRRGAARSFHFIGVQAVDADVIAPLEDGVPSESVAGVYPRLMAERSGAVAGFVSDAAFRDIGTPADLLDTSLALAAAAGRDGRPVWGARVDVDSTARVEHSCLWDDVRIGARAELDRCIVADGVTIAAGARYRRCAIVDGDDGLIVRSLDA